jgi:hypothetical protein
VDRLTPLRAPLASIALILLTLVAAARVGLGLSEVAAAGGSRAVAAARLAPNAGDAALTVCVGLLVVSCFLAPEVPARRRLAGWGVVLTALSLVATAVALGLSDLAVAGWNLVWGIPDLAVPLLVGVVLLVLARPARADEPSAPAATATVPGTSEAEDVPEPDPELEPSWSTDAAAGAVWRTAGEAARGVPAQTWGSSAEASWPTTALPPATSGRGDEASNQETPGAGSSTTPS